ncbi:MAG: class I SAM-dependent methyltransferase [Candidatus Dormiibacterota bacterium]
MTGAPEYADPRLAAIYDVVNPASTDTEFYLGLARSQSASSILDIGCGTGLLACELTQRGHRVTGVDPASAMLNVARRRPGGELVRWLRGDASRCDDAQADLALMTGHVAQVITVDKTWDATLKAVNRALRPGGRLAFESRNPVARAWTRWTPQQSRRTVTDPVHGSIEVWYRLIEVDGELVRFESHARLQDSGDELVSTNELRFRTQSDLTRSLLGAGFAVEHIFGGWDRQPVGARSPELIFIASRG